VTTARALLALGAVTTTRTLLALAAFALALAAPVRARAESPADVAVARELFREGSRHAQQGAWEEARERFERSLALRRAALTLYSLGVAQKNLGQIVEAIESFYAFLAEAPVPATRPYEAPARAAIAELEKRIARVTVRVAPPDAEGLRVRLDGDEIPRESLSLPRPINPGTHFLAVSARGHRPASQSFRVGEGEARDIALTLEPFALSPPDEAPAASRPAPCPAPLAPRPSPAPPPPPRTGLWVLATAGALAAAGGLWLSLDAVNAGDAGSPLAPDADRAARRRELLGQALTTGGLVSFGVGLGLLLAPYPAPAPTPPGARF
jgi:hypothetical protein